MSPDKILSKWTFVSINVTTPTLLLSKGLCFSQKNHPIYFCSPGGWWVPDIRYVVFVFAFAQKIFNNIFLFWLLLMQLISMILVTKTYLIFQKLHLSKITFLLLEHSEERIQKLWQFFKNRQGTQELHLFWKSIESNNLKLKMIS